MMTLALTLGLVVPALEGIRAGLTGGTWLAVGAVAAVILIAAGSMIERYRTGIGQRLTHFSEVLERWE